MCQSLKEKHWRKSKRLKGYSSFSLLQWCHQNCTGVSRLVSAAEAAVLWCVAKHFKLWVSYIWLGMTEICIFQHYCILEPCLSGRSRKHTLPSSLLLIKILTLVQKPLNHFWLGHGVNTVSFNLDLFQTLLIIYRWLSNLFFLFLMFMFLGSCLSRILSLCVLCCYFCLCLSTTKDETSIPTSPNTYFSSSLFLQLLHVGLDKTSGSFITQK